jgi:uncharacterized membrane protein YhaH (DUF805 family)
MSQQRRDFWFWVLAIGAISVLFATSLVYEFGLNAPWLPWTTGVVLLLATIGTGALLYADRKRRRSARMGAAPAEQYSPEQERKHGRALALLPLSMVVLSWLTNAGVLPRLLAASLAIVVFAIVTHYVLVKDNNRV